LGREFLEALRKKLLDARVEVLEKYQRRIVDKDHLLPRHAPL
jgi:hypothetical protein